MSKPIVHCRCGHQVRANEVLRTDLYERASGDTYVYVKFRCGWCKRLGESFVAEPEWDWSCLKPARDEMSEAERQATAGRAVITSAEIIDFHRSLQQLDGRGLKQALGGLKSADAKPDRARTAGKPAAPRRAEEVRAAESRAAESRAAEAKAENRSAESRSAEARGEEPHRKKTVIRRIARNLRRDSGPDTNSGESSASS